MKPPRRAAVVFILVTVFIDILAFGLIIPVLPHLIADFYGGDQGKAAEVNSWLSSGYWLIQFLSMPVLGAMSDHFGRRPVLLGSNLGIGLDFIVMAVATSMPLLYVGRLLSGLLSANFSTASAYIADVTPPDKRAAAFGLMGAMFGLGFVIGPALGGILGEINPRLPFWIAAGLSIANFCYGYFILPESLQPEHRRAFEWRKANPFSALKWLAAKPQLFGLAIVAFLGSFAHVVYPSTFVMFADYRFQWGIQTVGLVLGCVGVCAAIVQGGLIRWFVKQLGERRMMLLGLACGVFGFLGYAWAPTGTWFLVFIPVMALWGLAGPGVQSLMSGQIDASEQGRLQGAVNCLSSLANIVAPQVFAHTFAAFIHSGERQASMGLEIPGAAFIIASALLLLALLVAWRSTSHRTTAKPASTAAESPAQPAGH